MKRIYIFLTLLFCSLGAWAQFDYEKALKSLNELREDGCNCGNEAMRPASNLLWDQDLADIAMMYAAQLSAANKNNNQHIYLSHVGTDASTTEDRLQANDYMASACVENIAYLKGNFDMVLDHWLNNPQSCKNLLNRKMTAVGVAQRGDFWVVLMAVPKKLIH
jgi:uncharacterized protein YkwD